MRFLALAHATIWTVLACVSVRFVPLWALLVLPVLGDALTAARRGAMSGLADVTDGDQKRDRARVAVTIWMRRLGMLSRRVETVDGQVGRGVWSGLAIVFVLIVLAAGGRLPASSVPALNAHFDPTVFPVAAAQRLHTDGLPPGRGFTTYEWGGYLDFALPEYHVFVDSRSDAYSQQLLQDYATIVSLGPGWRDLLQAYDIQWALLPTGSPLAQVLALSPDWRCAGEDSAGVASLCILSAP